MSGVTKKIPGLFYDKGGGGVWNVKHPDFGGIGDGATDDTDAIQGAIIEAWAAGGGIVRIPTGTYLTTGLILYPFVILEGTGLSEIKLADNANSNVITSLDFDTLTGSGLWFVSEGVPVGFGIRSVRINGNKANNTSGHGICVYGKRYYLTDVIIFETAEDGLYTECGSSPGQSEADDMPEAMIDGLHIRNPDGNGVTYCGPHDGYIDGLFVSEASDGYGILVKWDAGTPQTFNGKVDIGFAHVYACHVGARFEISTNFNMIKTRNTDRNY